MRAAGSPRDRLCRSANPLSDVSKLVDEIEFRKHLINKFDDNLGGWCRVENCDPRSTGLVYYQQVWDADGEINGLCHKSGNEKRAFSLFSFLRLTPSLLS